MTSVESSDIFNACEDRKFYYVAGIGRKFGSQVPDRKDNQSRRLFASSCADF